MHLKDQGNCAEGRCVASFLSLAVEIALVLTDQHANRWWIPYAVVIVLLIIAQFCRSAEVMVVALCLWGLGAFFVVGADGAAELVNYRVTGRFLIVDRLFHKAELRLGAGRRQVRVKIENRKRGRS